MNKNSFVGEEQQINKFQSPTQFQQLSLNTLDTAAAALSVAAEAVDD